MLTYPDIIAHLATLDVPPPARQAAERWRFRASVYCAILAVGINQRRLMDYTGLPMEDLEPIIDSLHSNDLLLTGALSENYVKQFLRSHEIVDLIVGRTHPVLAAAPTGSLAVAPRSRRIHQETKTSLITRMVLPLLSMSCSDYYSSAASAGSKNAPKIKAADCMK